PQSWRFTLEKPANGWEKPDFKDDSWKKGPGGFGTNGTPGAIVRTEWKTGDIWLRQTFELKEEKGRHLHLRIHHDEDVEVYLNGQKIASFTGFVTNYFETRLPETALKALRSGTNTLAVYCKQTTGGQYIDVGLVELVEKPR